jgi:predicted MFS family arabinose efflux permease
VSTPEGQEPAFRCPRCGAELGTDQEWCLNCGTAARTTIAATPNWRLPIALIAVVAVLCGAALAWAFVELTNNDAEVRAATAKVTQTQTDPAVAPPSTTTTPPAG